MGGEAFDIARALKGLRWLLARDLVLILQLGVIWAVVAAIASMLSEYIPSEVQGFVGLNQLVGPFFVAAFTAAALSTNQPTLSNALKAGRLLYVQFVVVLFITFVLLHLGLKLMVLPGIALAILVSCAPSVLFREDTGIMGALIEGARLVLPRFWRVAACYLVVTVPVMVFAGLILLADQGLSLGVSTLVILSIVGVFAQVITTYLGAAIYLEATHVSRVQSV
ncbi:YciC family protein [Hyphomonas chukchiensis]|uniref:Glycerophosphoryl diester phosphodiesterase membrane domain-containing protein n=1 Tax=Hyphomonas chukchiensis TaxID=1280947 RepID=A0A062URW5_9PROT|nr:YciC family protein [Hyphomonas chukchiensis]KCZ60194.1 hypothetical protein HY30_12050 [Hyphomonas chukchiensis]